MITFSDTWGDEFPIADPDWDLIIASDILLCKLLFYLLLSYAIHLMNLTNNIKNNNNKGL